MEEIDQPQTAIELLTSLEARQDEVLIRLEELNAKIEAKLAELGKLKPAEAGSLVPAA
ncbi:MAG: hypothetical protein U0905_20765 [Pirellulales bacterium]